MAVVALVYSASLGVMSADPASPPTPSAATKNSQTAGNQQMWLLGGDDQKSGTTITTPDTPNLFKAPDNQPMIAPHESANDGMPFFDTDGAHVPVPTPNPSERHLTDKQIIFLKKREEAAEQDKNWLVNGYEEQMKLKAVQSDDPNSPGSSINNKDSSKNDPSQPVTMVHTDASDPSGAGTGAMNLRTDDAKAKDGQTAKQSFFKPLITPLSAPEAAGLTSFYGAQPTTLNPLLPADTTTKPDSAATDPSSKTTDPTADPSSIDTPGMTAMESDPMKSSTRFTLDLLPGETAPKAEKVDPQELKTPLQLPLATNSSQLEKLQTASLDVPGKPKALPEAPNHQLLLDIGKPQIVEMPRMQYQTRNQIADPSDFLHR